MSQAPPLPPPVVLLAPPSAEAPAAPPGEAVRSVRQKLDALVRAQVRAEYRVALGARLFGAAEAQLAEHRRMIAQLKAAQDAFGRQVEHDMNRSAHARPLQDYAATARADDGIAQALQSLEARMERLQGDWLKTQERIGEMMQRSEGLLRGDGGRGGETAPAPSATKSD